MRPRLGRPLQPFGEILLIIPNGCSFDTVTVTATPAGAQRSSSEPLWRSLAVFRFVSVGYAALRLGTVDQSEYSRPDWAWAVIAVLVELVRYAIEHGLAGEPEAGGRA